MSITSSSSLSSLMGENDACWNNFSSTSTLMCKPNSSASNSWLTIICKKGFKEKSLCKNVYSQVRIIHRPISNANFPHEKSNLK